MVHRFQNIYGISYTVAGNIKDIKSEIENVVLGVIEDKKLPFSTVYVKLPIFLMSKFMDELRKSNLNYEELETRKEFFLVKF
jgi:hypothetical protein